MINIHNAQLSPAENIPLEMLDSTHNNHPPKLRIRAEKKFGIKEERLILCANCGNPVTTSESVITVDGKHIHNFMNPSGVEYEIGCFASADGCAVFEEISTEATWFEGFSWSESICSNCFAHLGWLYESEDYIFFGLIVDNLSDSP
jgi:hypothetical protein